MESEHEDATLTPDRLCADCGSAISTSWHTHTFRYGTGESAADLTVRLPVRRCDSCDFDYLDFEGERIEHEAVCHHLGVLTPAEIRAVRKRHCLSRAAFAKITGIGETSLSRWESGIDVQDPANDRYLRLLVHPSVLALLQDMDGAVSLPAQAASPPAFPSQEPPGCGAATITTGTELKVDREGRRTAPCPLPRPRLD